MYYKSDEKLYLHDFEERFWRKVIKKSDKECWEWQAYINKAGYGVVSYRRKTILAHRVSWIIANGEIPNGLFVLHRCDNPRCVNPGHLFLGTYQDNCDDKWAKGRDNTPRGEKHCRAKLTEQQVREMKILYKQGGITQKKLAERFGATTSEVGNILCGLAWKHVVI